MGTDAGTGVGGHVGLGGGAILMFSPRVWGGGVRGGREGTHTGTHRNVHANVAPTLYSDLRLKKYPNVAGVGFRTC